MSSPRQLVLASTSRYRRQLLERLGLPFACANPALDETPLAGEAPAERAMRLATCKAQAVRDAWPDALIIGSDQVAALDGTQLDKPGTHENAVHQLQLASGRTVRFDTAVVLLDGASGEVRSRLVPCRVTFRALDAHTIDAYLRREQPYDCAGSAKAEGLGIALIERIDTADPTSLIGLPLIALTGMLAEAGVPVL
ncbi:MAG: Maf family nucleotide pyrophosphatase [Burkholderiales bacterium]